MKYFGKILFLTCAIYAFSLQAQEKRPVKDRVESFKIGFLTDRLNLTPEEAKSFWPVYNRYQEELEDLRRSRRANLTNARQNFDEMSDAEVEKTIDAELNSRQSELDLIKKYHPQFKKVLPVKKVARLYRAEEDFKRKLLDMIQERREDHKGMPPRR